MLLSLCACSFNANIKYTPGKGADVNGPQSGGETTGIEEMIEKNNEADGQEGTFASDDIKSYLLLGIDRSGLASGVDANVGGGQCDGVYVIAVNSKTGTTNILQLNRDTYVDIVVPDAFGNEMSTYKERLAIAYSHGSGMEDSCINAEKTVSKFLHGLKFDGYVAVYYDAIEPVVDSVGGVDVTLEKELTALDPGYVQGARVHMSGHDAYLFCRSRSSLGEETNTERLGRQRVFLNAFVGSCRTQIKTKSSIINDIYKAASPYIVSNLSQGELCNIGAKALSYKDGGIVSPAGSLEWVTGNDGQKYSQFVVDENSLSGILKDLFALEK